MPARLRRKTPSEEITPFLDRAESSMADTMLNGNKVSDVSMKDKGMTSKLTSNNNVDKSPSIHSDDSCTKLTVEKEEEVVCFPKDSTALIVLKLTSCFLCGIVFGIMFVKSRGK